MNLIGPCVPFLGTSVSPDEQDPSCVKGRSTCVAFVLFNIPLALCLRELLAWENRRLRKKTGHRIKEGPTKSMHGLVAEDKSSQLPLRGCDF